MKTFRIIGMVLMAIVMGVNFTSCKPNNNEEEPTKKLVKFSYDIVETTFKYDDQGRLIESVEVQKEDSSLFTTAYTYVWGDNTIEFTHSINGNVCGNHTLILENGLLTKLDSVYPFFDSTYTYNASGRVVKCEGFFSSRSFKWNDDRLIEKKIVSKSNTNIQTYAYETNATTKGYNPLISRSVIANDLFTAHPELTGTKSQQLFSSNHNYTIFYSDNEEYDYTLNYKYEFDEDGYVNKAIVTYDTEEGEVVNEIYTMVWE